MYCLCDFDRCNANGIADLKIVQATRNVQQNLVPSDRASKLVRRSSVSYITRLIPTAAVAIKNITISAPVNDSIALTESKSNSTNLLSSIAEFVTGIPQRIYQSYVDRQGTPRLGKFLIINETEAIPIIQTTAETKILSLNRIPKLKMKSLDEVDVKLTAEPDQANFPVSNHSNGHSEHPSPLKTTQNYQELATPSTTTRTTSTTTEATATTTVTATAAVKASSKAATSSKFLNKITVEYYPKPDSETQQPEKETAETEAINVEKKQTTLSYNDEAVAKRVGIIRKIEKLLDSMDFDEFLSLLESREIAETTASSLDTTTGDLPKKKLSTVDSEENDAILPYQMSTSTITTTSTTTVRTETATPLDLTISNEYESIPVVKLFTSIELPSTTTVPTTTETTTTTTQPPQYLLQLKQLRQLPQLPQQQQQLRQPRKQQQQPQLQLLQLLQLLP